MLTGFRYAARAMQGARDTQEDACKFASPNGNGTVPLDRRVAPREQLLLAVLADGMGGHAGGAEASAVACDAFIAAYQSGTGAARARLAGALDTSNRAISAALKRDRSLAGMGCTLIGAAFTDEGLNWVSVGDSPLLLFRDGRLYQLNEDHSLAPVLDRLARMGEMSAAEAESHPRRHFLRAALTGATIELVDLSASVLPLRPGDLILLASDGIEVLSHAEIADMLALHDGEAPEQLAEVILAAVEAKADANQDNVTVMAVRPVFAGEAAL